MMFCARDFLCASAGLLALISNASAQDVPDPRVVGGKGEVEIAYNDLSLTLTLSSRDARVTAADANGLIDVFNVAMHAERALFSDAPCPRWIILSIVDESEFHCGGVDVQAACASYDASDPSIGLIEFNGRYLSTTPAYDVIAHETMHQLQGPVVETTCDFWREGEGDLARYYWGGAQNQLASGFSLPAPGAMDDILTDSRAAGAFLVWFHQHWHDEALQAFHRIIASGACPENAFWKATTGLDWDGLWNAYANPSDPTDS